MSRAAAQHPGSRWYRPSNSGRYWKQVAIQRYGSDLLERGRITRGEKALIDELSKWVDGRGICQKSIAFIASRMKTHARTVQRYLRRLCPSKRTDPKGWENRVLTRQYIHAVPEPGKKIENLPSWFRFDNLDLKWLEPSPAATKRAATKRGGGLRLVGEAKGAPSAPPGGRKRAAAAPGNFPENSAEPSPQEAVTRGGTKRHPSSDHRNSLHTDHCNPPSLLPPGELATEPRPPDVPELAPGVEDARGETPRTPSDHPRWQPKHADLVVLAAQLFESHAAKAPEAIARLEAIGLTHDQIAAKLRRDSKDRSLEFGQAKHPLLAAVSRAEKAFLLARSPPPSNDRQRPASAEQTPIPRRTGARFAEMSEKVARAGLTLQPRESGEGDGGRGGGGDDEQTGGGEDVGGGGGPPPPNWVCGNSAEIPRKEPTDGDGAKPGSGEDLGGGEGEPTQ